MIPAGSLLTLALIVGGPPAVLELSVTPTDITVGDPVTAELELSLPVGVRAVLPAWAESWGAAEIRRVEEPERVRTADGGERIRQRLVITFFRPGEFELPSPDVELVGGNGDLAVETGTPPTVTVRSVLPADEAALEPRPPARPRQLGWGSAFLWTAAVLTLLLILAMVELARRTRAERASSEPSLDPLSGLLSTLTGLRSEPSAEAVISGLSLALRRFLGTCLGFPAAESTTTEIRQRLRIRDLEPELVSRCETILRACDGVKFARRPASRRDAEESLAAAEDLAARVFTAVRPEPTVEGEAGA